MRPPHGRSRPSLGGCRRRCGWSTGGSGSPATPATTTGSHPHRHEHPRRPRRAWNKEGDDMNAQHKSGIDGQGKLPQPPRSPQLGKVGSGGIQMGRWRMLLTVGVAIGLVVLHVSTGAMHHGDVKTVTFTAPKGSTEFSCTWHRGMVGRIVAT